MEAKNLLKQIAEIAGVQFSEEKTETPIVEQEVKLEDAQPEAEQEAEVKPDLNKMVEDLTGRVAKLEEALTQTTADLAMSKEANVKLNKIVETIANTPISEPLQRTESLELSSKSEDDKYKLFVR